MTSSEANLNSDNHAVFILPESPVTAGLSSLGFLKPENRVLVLARESPAELLEALDDWRLVSVEKCLDWKTR